MVLICALLMISVIEHLFTCLLSICISFLEKCHSILPIFSVELFVFWFLVLSYVTCLYLLDIILYSPNHLQIFLLFGRFFSFALQNLLSLIKFHLFIYAFVSFTFGHGSKMILL